MKFKCVRVSCAGCDKNRLCDESPYYGMENLVDDDFINVSWRNTYNIGVDAINAPITTDGRCIGVIKEISSEYVYGRILAKAVPELRVEDSKCVGFEIVGGDR